MAGGVLTIPPVDGFLGNLDALYEQADCEGLQWEAFFQRWYAVWGEAPVTVADVVAALNREEALSEALPDELADAATAGKSLPRRLGKALSRRAETRFPGGLVLARAGRGHGDVTLWVVRDAAP